MSSEPTKVVRELIEQWNRHDAVRAANLLANDVEYWDVTQASPFKRRSQVQAFFEAFFSAFPNLSFDVLNVFSEGPQVVCEWRMRGTQEKELEGIIAIGKSIDIAGVSLCRIEEGKIVRQVDYWDSATMMRQLGLAPKTKAVVPS